MITDFGWSDVAEAVAIQPDGRIVVVGQSDGRIVVGQPDETSDPPERDDIPVHLFAVARYNQNGSLDASFGSGGKVTTQLGLGGGARDVAVQADGKIVAAGWAAPALSNNAFALARYNPDGSLDDGTAADTTPGDAFGSGGVVLAQNPAVNRMNLGEALAVQTDGKLVVAGRGLMDANGNWDFELARFNGTDGSLDASFGTGGWVTTGFGTNDGANAVALQADGKILAAGNADYGNQSDFALARYHPS